MSCKIFINVYNEENFCIHFKEANVNIKVKLKVVKFTGNHIFCNARGHAVVTS